MSDKWSVSRDGEIYHGEFDSREEAIEEGREWNEGPFWVGKREDPTQPEWFWNAEGWIDSVLDQDGYRGDWASFGDSVTKEQRKELEAEVRPILAAWLDRHGLRPTHFNIDPGSVVKIEAEEADPDKPAS